MATIKKNQLANIVFPMVDGTDFASIESGLTASDFESKVTKKFFGVTHGNSTAFTSGTISKAATLVRSGIFQQTLKAAETNYDYVMYSFAPANTSLAHQMLVFHPVDYDDSDIMSRISDVSSDLRSYLVGMSGMLSDVYSNLSDFKSDFQSRVPKQVATFSRLSDYHSDLRSYLLGMSGMLSDVQSALDSQFVWTSNFLSDMNSDLSSQIGGITASVSASDISDIASAVWAAKYTAHSVASSFGSLVSDVYSRLALTQSNVSDIQSALDSQFVWTSAFLSDMNSDLSSQIGGIAVTVTASDMSDIASRVWATTEGTRVDSRILVIQSNLSDVDSQLLLNASMISDTYSLLSDHHSDFQSRVAGALATSNQLSQVQSDLLSYLAGLSGALSDVQSAIDSQFVWTSNFLSDMNSDLSSQIGGITASVSVSDMSDIASRVWATAEGTRVDSRILVIQSLVSDVDSQVNLLATSNYLSQVHSDLRSQVSGITASVSASDISDIASAVWAAKYGTHSLASSFGSLVSDVYSRLALTQSNISDIQSALDSQFVWTSGFLSDMNSDLSSQIGGITATVSASDMSDIASRVWATAEGTRVDSRILVIQSNLSDVESQVDLLATSNYLSQVHSDLTSQIGGIAVTVTASDMSDIASRVWATAEGTRVDSRILVIQSAVSDVDSQLLLNASIISDVYSLLSDHHSDFQSRVAGALATSNQLSQAHSDLRSYLIGLSGALSDVESQVDLLATSNYLSQVHSDLYSAIGNVSVALTASDISDIASAVADAISTIGPSDISDIASAVWAAKYTAHSLASSFGSLFSDVYSRVALTQSNVSDIDSQLTLTHSLVSDIESQVDLLATSNYLSQVHSDLYSAVGAITAGIDASDISDIASAVWADTIGARVDSRLRLVQSNVSDVESQLDLTASIVSDIYSLLSDVESQVDLNASVASDIQSALDSQFTYMSGAISDVESQVDLLATSDYLSQVHSDLYSAIGNVSVTLTDSDISDIASGIIAGLSAVTFPSGAIDFTYTVVDSVSGNPIFGVDVWISTDLAGTNVVWRGTTDALGVARNVLDNLPALDAGVYYFWRQSPGHIFDDPDTEVVS